MKKFDFIDIQKAFANGTISLHDFAIILADNFGKKKARKILRKNLEPSLKDEGIPKKQIEEYLALVTLLVEPSDFHREYLSPDLAYGFD
jgi:2-hydroxy-3-keto-5-methylthiopentenyl-1-phosphate phosphatase